MTASYPTSIDSPTNPSSSSPRNNPSLAGLITDLQAMAVALETKVGVTSSTDHASHEYKLSGVALNDKAASLLGSETLSSKILTAPNINMGSDATGDIYYRNAAGAFTRLPAGASSTILNIDSVTGLPSWIANPSASNASSTVKGVVQAATSSQITAGTATGSTGATLFISPDQLASSAPTFSGANLTNLPNPGTYKVGSTTKNPGDASTVQTIAHGLGKIPKKVKLTYTSFFTTTISYLTSVAVYDGTTQSSISYYLAGSTYTLSSSLILNSNTASSGTQTGVVTFDATNIYITWTAASSPSGNNYDVIWEAEV